MAGRDTSLFLVRHGQTEGNVRNLFIGSTDVPLDETGEWQARLLAEKSRELTIDAIVSSPLRRAVQTAEAIAALHGLVLKVRHDLAEIDFGEAEGLAIEVVRARFPELFRLHAQPDSGGVRWPGGESREEFSKRVVASIHDICRIHSGKSVAVICHGGVIGALLSLMEVC